MPIPFPQNGPHTNPVFDGHDLMLLKNATPPEVLEHNIAKLGTEVTEGHLRSNGKESEFTWPPPPGSDLERILSRDELLKVGTCFPLAPSATYLPSPPKKPTDSSSLLLVPATRLCQARHTRGRGHPRTCGCHAHLVGTTVLAASSCAWHDSRHPSPSPHWAAAQ